MNGTTSFNTETLYTFTWVFVVALISKELVLCANQRNVLSKTCSSAGTFRVTFWQSFEACVDECQRRQRCEFIMYKHGINECHLKNFVNITALTDAEPICLFTDIKNTERTARSPCDKDSCGLTETCVTSSKVKTRFECVKSECLTPHAIVNAIVLSSDRVIGNKNGYKCDPMFIGKGDPFITCKNDGTWTSTSFRCVKRGKTPASDLKIADISSVDGEKWLPGTRITFTCRPGYQGLGNSASSVLSSNGLWWPRVVKCCNENITDLIWGHTCRATFNGSLANDFGDMAKYCRDKGGYISGVDPDLARLVLGSEGYLWLINGATKTNYLLLLKECLEIHKVFDLLENFSQYTYSQLVGEVIARNLTGSGSCDSVRWWAPGEPSGGDAEMCVAYRNGTYAMFDVGCSSWVYAHRSDIGFLCQIALPTI